MANLEMNIVLFIGAVFKRRAIWDQKDKNHRDRFILDELWNTIITEELKEVNCTVAELKKKWKNLRDKYRIELNKLPKKKFGDGTDADMSRDDDDANIVSDDYTESFSSWPHFDSLRLLKVQFTQRPNKGNLTSTPLESPQSIVSPKSAENSVDPSMCDPEDELFQDGTSRTSSTPSSSGVNRKEKSIPSSTATSSSVKRPKTSSTQSTPVAKNDYEQALLKLEERKVQLLEGDSNNTIMAFFESLIPHVGKLPDEKQMLMSMEILQVAYRYVYGSEQLNISRTSESYLPPGYMPASQSLNYSGTPMLQTVDCATSQQQHQQNYANYLHI